MSGQASDWVTIGLADLPATDAFGLSIVLDGAELGETIAAAGPGVFRSRRRGGGAPVGANGALLRAGALAGFLKQGPLLLPVAMPVDGWVLAVAPDGTRVEHGSPLFRILRATGAIIP